jgi:hypothetical protein
MRLPRPDSSMLSLQSSTAATSVADPPDAPARALGGTATGQSHVPASTVLHLQAAGRRVEEGDASSLADIGVTSGSLPATLCRMRDIAVATGSGTLNDDARSKLQAEYSQLSQSVARAVNSAIQEHAQAEAAAQAQAVQAQDAQRANATAASHDASSHGDSRESRQRADQAVARRPDLVVANNATASAEVRTLAEAHPAASQHRTEAAHAAGLAQFQRQTAAPRPVLSVVA